MKNTSVLPNLRKLIDKFQIDAYLIPSTDSHNSEYLSKRDKRRSFVSNFKGSAGTAVVTKNKAALWTDGRYWQQAEKELSSDWILMKQGHKDCPTIPQWLQQELGEKYKIGLDPQLSTLNYVSSFEGHLVYIDENLVDSVWEDRPLELTEKIMVLGVEYAGKSVGDKLVEIRKDMSQKKTDAFIITALDEIAWLLNIRGSDIPHNPVIFSYCLLTSEQCTLYINEKKLDESSIQHFKKENITTKPYDSVFSDLKSFAEKIGDKKVLLDKNKISVAISNCFKSGSIVFGDSPIDLRKGMKNPVEIEGMRNCHIRDGAAKTEFFAWLEHRLEEGGFYFLIFI